MTKAKQYAYRDRRQRKRQFRALWITRINAGARCMGYLIPNSLVYKKGVEVDRKVLADMAIFDKPAFQKFVEIAKSNLGTS